MSDLSDKWHFKLDWGNAVPRSKWFGITALKNPLDAWIYQEIISENKPDLIIECGTHEGGGALHLAHLCELNKNGKVITIELNKQIVSPELHHERLEIIIGDSVSDEVVSQIKGRIKNGDKVMVILDSDHHKEHVLKELEIYGELVTPGQYLIVEDTFWNPDDIGPYPAVKEFLEKNKSFSIDTDKERFVQTYNPNGFLIKS